MTRLAWVRNRNAAGRGNDPMPVILHSDVGLKGLEIVAEYQVEFDVGLDTIDSIASILPAPEVKE